MPSLISKKLQSLTAKTQKISIPVIENLTDYQKATDTCKFIKGLRDMLEDARRTKTDPLLAKQKSIKAAFDVYIDPLDVVLSDIKKSMSTFIVAEQARKDEEQRLLEVKAKAENPTKDVITVDIVNDIRTQRGTEGTSTARKRWDFKVVDESLVPVEFKMIDEGKIRLAIKAGVRVIPGLSIIEETYVSIR